MIILRVTVLALVLTLALADISEKSNVQENPKEKREAPIHRGPPPKAQALIGGPIVMHSPALTYGPAMLNLGSSLGSSIHLSGRNLHGLGPKLTTGKGYSGGSFGGQSSFGGYKGGLRGSSLGGHSFGSFGGQSSLGGLSFGGHGLSGGRGSSYNLGGRGSFGGQGLPLGGGHSFGGSLKGLSGASLGSSYGSGHGFGGPGQSFGGGLKGSSFGGGHSFGSGSPGGLKGGSLGGLSFGGGSGHSFGGSLGGLKGGSFGGLSLGGGHSFASGGMKGGSIGGLGGGSGHNFVSGSLGGLKGGNLAGLSLGGSGGHSFGSFGSGPKGLGGLSLGSGSFGGGHSFGGGNSLGSSISGGQSFGGYGPSFGGSLKGSGFSGASLGTGSFGHGVGGNAAYPAPVPANTAFMTGQGLSGLYGKRLLGLGQSVSTPGNSYSGASYSSSTSGANLGHGQSFNGGQGYNDIKELSLSSGPINLGDLKGGFDSQNIGLQYSGQGAQHLDQGSGRQGAQNLHASVNFGSSEPQQSYGLPSTPQQSYGGPSASDYSSGTTLMVQQTGSKTGPVTFGAGSPLPNSLSNTYVTVANNPSNSYGVPTYAQNSYSSSSEGSYANLPSQSYGQPDMTQVSYQQPETSYAIPETSYGVPETSYQQQSYEQGTSYGPPSYTTGSDQTSGSGSSGSYSGNTGSYQGTFKPSAFLGATSVSNQDSYSGLSDNSVGPPSYETSGSSYEAPNYNTISYSMPTSVQTQYSSH